VPTFLEVAFICRWLDERSACKPDNQSDPVVAAVARNYEGSQVGLHPAKECILDSNDWCISDATIEA
jgi:hypothetical protein